MDAIAQTYPETRTKFLENGVLLLSSRVRSSNSRYWDLAERSIHKQMEVAQSRSRLWSLVSHELRTPLTIIKSSAQLLRRGAAEHQERFAEKIVCQTDHLQLLIEDLIALCLLQSGVGISEAKEIDVMELVNEICKQMERDGVQISVVKRDPLAPIVAERSLLHRAIRHLVDNAVKFSPPGSEVRVET